MELPRFFLDLKDEILGQVCTGYGKPIFRFPTSAALKKGMLEDAATQSIVQVMSALNKIAAEALNGLDVHALTNVTGFGLIGHLSEILGGSRVGARLITGEQRGIVRVDA